MGTFKGTQGKWEFVHTEQHPTVENEWHSVVEMPKIAISITNTKFTSKEETEANAKAIAAVPDMIESLQWAVAFGKNGESHDKMIIDKCLKALLKATE